MPNSADYYNDSTQWGNYQYINLNEVIDNYMMSLDPDDYTGLVPRHRVLYQARRGLRELYYDVLKEIRAIELELSTSLMVTLPPDFINMVRLSWIDDKNQLHPMAVDNKISLAQTYLQDNEYEILFDDEGCVLKDESTPDFNPEASGRVNADTDRGGFNYFSFCDTGYQPNRNMSNVYINGRYNIDKNRGVIFFGSEVFTKSIVLEYISDGLFTGCEGQPEAKVRVNKFAESAILNFIHYELVKNRRNVPYNEKIRARKEFFNSRRIAKRRISTLRREELAQTFKGASVVIKR